VRYRWHREGDLKSLVAGRLVGSPTSGRLGAESMDFS
jgi:hypothetical protein